MSVANSTGCAWAMCSHCSATQSIHERWPTCAYCGHDNTAPAPTRDFTRREGACLVVAFNLGWAFTEWTHGMPWWTASLGCLGSLATSCLVIATYRALVKR